MGIKDEFGAIAGTNQEDLELHDAKELVDQLIKLGVRIINVSSGGPSETSEIVRPTNDNPEGVFAHFRRARTLMEHVNHRALVVGSGYSWLGGGKNEFPEEVARTYSGIDKLGNDQFHKTLLFWAATNVLNDWTDMAGIGRQLLADPRFLIKMQTGRLPNWCKACGGCSAKGYYPHVGCVVHDEAAQLIYRAWRSMPPRELEISLD